MKWRQVYPGVWVFRDSCNVYAVRGPEGMLIVDAGSGRWLEHLAELPGPPAALACTHYFRDHAAGAAGAARAGIPLFVPAGERAIFADPAEHFRRRETYIIYDNLWNLFAPIEGAEVAGVLRDYERTRLAGLEVEVVPLPGATVTQVGLSVRMGERKMVFCGEAIHSPGKLARVAPLQYNYNDLLGAVQCHWSAQHLREHRPDALLPSLGEPMLDHADAALAELQKSLRYVLAERPGMTAQLDMLASPPLQRVTDHLWRDMHSMSINWYLLSRSGKALVFDYGYNYPAWAVPAYANPPHRRALLHGLDGLKKQFGIERIDVALISHFHDDHVCGVPLLQRLFGTQCWAAANFADLLDQPQATCFPCTWPEPIRVDRRLPLDKPFTWEEYTFHLHPMNGHTRFAALIGFEADGKRFAHTGDQYFFGHADASPALDMTRFDDKVRFQNHVYRNGALLDGYEISGKWMLQWRPDIVIQGHQPAFFTNEAFFGHIAAWNEHYQRLHQTIMPLGDEQTHLNVDSWGGWIWPYRTHMPAPAPATVKVTVRNPLPRRATLEVKLVGPAEWKGTSARLTADARAEVSATLTITPAGPCRRQPFAVEVTAEGQPLGQVAEALMTVGGAEF